jgi:aldose 1-epimerase
MNKLPSTAQRHYGYLGDGTEVTLVTLKNTNGIEVDAISYGGIITRLTAPDAAGKPATSFSGWTAWRNMWPRIPTSAL